MKSFQRKELMRRRSWRGKSKAQKIAAVVRHLDRRRTRRAWSVGFALGISEATARKYLRLAVMEGRAAAEPPLYQRSIGATEREFRLANRRDREERS